MCGATKDSIGCCILYFKPYPTKLTTGFNPAGLAKTGIAAAAPTIPYPAFLAKSLVDSALLCSFSL
jgi:hypothetical protein